MPANRPSIPIEIQRDVLVESGHRCSVCGENCPLEQAHIIPWSKVQDHKLENLICLCANCHSRADKENWGEKTLKKYKERPWVLRRFDREDVLPSQKTKVEIRIQMKIEDFTDREKRFLSSGIAGFLEISPTAV
jgi:type I restriction enzyme R subunit